MKNIRQSVYQGMVSFIQQTTRYNLKDISKVIQEPYENVRHIMRGQAYPVNHDAELNLAKLYAISLDLYHLYHAYGKDNDANV